MSALLVSMLASQKMASDPIKNGCWELSSEHLGKQSVTFNCSAISPAPQFM